MLLPMLTDFNERYQKNANNERNNSESSVYHRIIVYPFKKEMKGMYKHRETFIIQSKEDENK